MSRKRGENFFDDEILKHLPDEYKKFLTDFETDPFYPYPFQEDIHGPIQIGLIPGTQTVFGLLPTEINQHALYAGRSGSGKTTANRHTFGELYPRIPCWFIDFKKDYRHLLPYAPDLIIFRWRSLRINPLRPPQGTDPLKWIQIFADCFCQSFGLMSASKSLIVEIIEELYETYGVFDGRDIYPSMFEFHEKLERRSHRKGLPWDERGYITRSKNKTTVCVKLLKDTFDCDRGFPLEDLLAKNVVFEFDGLMDELQTFMVNLILSWVFTYRLEREERGSLQQVIFFDEARKVFKKNYKTDLGTPIIDLMVTQIRETGVGLVISDQIPHQLSDAAKSNCFTIITLSLSNGKDIEDMARTMRLTREQADMLNKLEVGQGIVKLAGRYPEPFPIVLPNVHIEAYLSDAEVDRKMKQTIDGFSIVPRTPLDSIQRTQHSEKHDSSPKQRHMKQPSDSTTGSTTDSSSDFIVKVNEIKRVKKKLARDFLIHIEKHPHMNVTETYRSLGLSAYKGNKVQKELVENGLLEEKRMGKSIYLILTEKGRAAIGSEVPKERGRGKEEHRLYQEKIKSYYEDLGYSAYIEKDRYGKAIDVLVMKPGSLVAYEVELHNTNHIMENISRDLAVGVDRVVIVTTSNLLEKIQKRIGAAYPANTVSIETIDTYLGEA